MAFEDEIVKLILASRGRSGEGRTSPSRGKQGLNPADPFGLTFSKNLSTGLGVAAKLGIPNTRMAQLFVDIMRDDAQKRSDKFFGGLTTGDIPSEFDALARGRKAGFSISRRATRKGAEFTNKGGRTTSRGRGSPDRSDIDPQGEAGTGP